MISVAGSPQVQEAPSEAEEVLLSHALAVRLILSRMEEAVRLGAEDTVVPDLDDLWDEIGRAHV